MFDSQHWYYGKANIDFAILKAQLLLMNLAVYDLLIPLVNKWNMIYDDYISL